MLPFLSCCPLFYSFLVYMMSRVVVLQQPPWDCPAAISFLYVPSHMQGSGYGQVGVVGGVPE